MKNKTDISNNLYSAIVEVIQQARQQVKQAVSQSLLADWQIGRLIVE